MGRVLVRPEIDGKTIIRSTTNRVRCSGENNDHPLVYYTIPEGGYVVCGYCDLVFMREENKDFSYISHDEEDDLRDVWNNAKNMDGRYVKKQR